MTESVFGNSELHQSVQSHRFLFIHWNIHIMMSSSRVGGGVRTFDDTTLR